MGTCLLCRSIPHLTIDSVNIIIDKPSSLTYRPHTLPKIHRYKTSAPDFSFLSAAIFHPRQLPANISLQSPICYQWEFRIFLPFMSDDQFAVLLHHGSFHFSRWIDMVSSQFERYIMSTQTNFLAIFNVDFSIVNDYQRPAVYQLLCFHVILLYSFQCQHQRAPYTQNPDVIQNLNAIVINDASNDATQYIVLNLIAGRWRRQITFSGNIDDYRQCEKANQQFYCY